MTEMLNLGNVHISYIILIVSLVILVGENLLTEGRPPYFRSEEWYSSEAYRIYMEEKAKGNA
jgi:hypothetical protein